MAEENKNKDPLEELAQKVKEFMDKTLSPTEEQSKERKEQESKYFKEVLPTYIESWPNELCQLSIAQSSIKLTPAETIALASCNGEFGEAFKNQEIDVNDLMQGLTFKLNHLIEQFPNGAFVRLGSRSPKDVYMGKLGSFKVFDGIKAIKILTGESERVFQDLSLAINMCYCPSIFVREWVDLENWQEFRCFVKDRKLVGVSQYYYDDYLPLVDQENKPILWVISNFFERSVLPALHLDNVIVDVFVKRTPSNGATFWETKLLEINPFGFWTDPCLFDWRDNGDFNESFRFINSYHNLSEVRYGRNKKDQNTFQLSDFIEKSDDNDLPD